MKKKTVFVPKKTRRERAALITVLSTLGACSLAATVTLPIIYSKKTDYPVDYVIIEQADKNVEITSQELKGGKVYVKMNCKLQDKDVFAIKQVKVSQTVVDPKDYAFDRETQTLVINPEPLSKRRDIDKVYVEPETAYERGEYSVDGDLAKTKSLKFEVDGSSTWVLDASEQNKIVFNIASVRKGNTYLNKDNGDYIWNKVTQTLWISGSVVKDIQGDVVAEVELTDPSFLYTQQEFVERANKWVKEEDGFCDTYEQYTKEQVTVKVDGVQVTTNDVIYDGLERIRKCDVEFGNSSVAVAGDLYSGTSMYNAGWLAPYLTPGTQYDLTDEQIIYTDTGAIEAGRPYKEIRINQYGYVTYLEDKDHAIEITYNGIPEMPKRPQITAVTSVVFTGDEGEYALDTEKLSRQKLYVYGTTEKGDNQPLLLWYDYKILAQNDQQEWDDITLDVNYGTYEFAKPGTANFKIVPSGASSYDFNITVRDTSATCLVTVDVNDGITETTTTRIDKGTQFDQPTAPTRGDMVFLGWYNKKPEAGETWDYEHKWNFNNPVEDSMTLYARWGNDFNNVSLEQMTQAINDFEGVAEPTTTHATDLCKQLGVKEPVIVTDNVKATLQQNLVGLVGTMMINDQPHIYKCIDCLHDVQSNGKYAALTFELFSPLSDKNGAAYTTMFAAGGVVSESSYVDSILRKCLSGNGNGSFYWHDQYGDQRIETQTAAITWIPTIIQNSLKTVKKVANSWADIGGYRYAQLEFYDKVFALSCDEMAIAGMGTTPAEGTPYEYWARNEAEGGLGQVGRCKRGVIESSATTYKYIIRTIPGTTYDVMTNYKYHISTDGSLQSVFNPYIRETRYRATFAFCI